ncbi:MAG: alanine racemase [Ilumatobacter sp.]|uniref:alanine racemase n=1 Tax=Ilumatobacter sp. TaxID=1967498 RepID=UPI00262120AF|nr:alanine racemase [Ilumatobacter sp.]MDJ0770384.1 alanine racemase [Ilumatobacter sp.]
MTIRLTVNRTRWWNHVTYVADTVSGLVPVVKGNGYGFGRAGLAIAASELSPLLAVGTIHELDGLPGEVTPIVLTPTLSAPDSTTPVLTVSNQSHVDALRDWPGRVIVKLVSDMQRYGADVSLVGAAQRVGLRTVGVSIHPPLAGDDDAHRDQIVRQLPDIDPSLDVWVSHLAPTTYETLPDSHRYKLRLGTYLWHGDREALRLEADVLETRPVRAGMTAGYRLTEVAGDGTMLMVGAGTANNVVALPDGRSPFHFHRTRLALHEPPHMHTSMVFVPAGDACPGVGDWVDLQRPLTQTHVDELRWI